MNEARSLARWIEEVRFTPTRGSGYDMGDVDQLLDHLAKAVAISEPLRPIVEVVKLRTVKLREGYDRAEVDAFLQDVALQDDAGSGRASPAASAVEPDPVVQEQKGMWGRLFGR